MAILILKLFLKFQIDKKQTKKDPLNIKKSKIILNSSDQTHPAVRFLALRNFLTPNWQKPGKNIKIWQFLAYITVSIPGSNHPNISLPLEARPDLVAFPL